MNQKAPRMMVKSKKAQGPAVGHCCAFLVHETQLSEGRAHMEKEASPGGAIIYDFYIKVGNKGYSFNLADLDKMTAKKQCMYCEAKTENGEEIVLCKNCIE